MFAKEKEPEFYNEYEHPVDFYFAFKIGRGAESE